MDLPRVLWALALGDHADELRPEWEQSQQCRPPGEVGFLSAAFLRRACRYVFGSAALAEPAIPIARAIAADGARCALTWHFHYRVYHSKTANWEEICAWPDLTSLFGRDMDIYWFLILLSGAEIMRQVHRARKIPGDVVRETMAGVTLPPAEEGGTRRRPAMSQFDVARFRAIFRGDTYRLGRLAYEMTPLTCRVHVFRHRTSGVVTALSDAGIRYRPDGQVDAREEAPDGWVATLAVTHDEVTGHPILPTGAALPRRVTLPLREWRQIIAPGGPSIHFHIPGDGGPLTASTCCNSFETAFAFFPRHFPEYRTDCYYCVSWTFNTWLETVLPPESNLLAFQREVYLLPVHLDPSFTIRYVFGELPDDLSQAPRDTSLRRALLDMLASGGAIGHGGGGCFLFAEDLKWGAQVYRSQQPPLELS